MAEAKAWIMIPKSDKKAMEIVIDMHPLVLCKDCKWRGHEDDSPKWLPCFAINTNNDWYCANGERKEVMMDDSTIFQRNCAGT